MFVTTKKYVLSEALSLKKAGQDFHNIFHTESGTQLQISSETLKILFAFQQPLTFDAALAYFGIESTDEATAFQKVFEILLVAEFVIEESSPESSPRAHDANTPIFIASQITFMGCESSPENQLPELAIVFAGIPIDFGVSARPGTRFGPDKLREVSNQFITNHRDIFSGKSKGWYCADLNKTILRGKDIVDLGNLIVEPSEDPASCFDKCYQGALKIFKQNGFPVFIGGDHSLSAPIIKACQETYSELTVVHFDAHTDMAPWNPNRPHHHGNVMSRVLTENSTLTLYQYGIRGFSGQPVENPRYTCLRQQELNQIMSVQDNNRFPTQKKCYLTIDIDVLDPVFAPGTGTPVPMGMPPSLLLLLLERIIADNSIVGIDLVELSPDLDHQNLTTSLVFHLMMHILGMINL